MPSARLSPGNGKGKSLSLRIDVNVSIFNWYCRQLCQMFKQWFTSSCVFLFSATCRLKSHRRMLSRRTHSVRTPSCVVQTQRRHHRARRKSTQNFHHPPTSQATPQHVQMNQVKINSYHISCSHATGASAIVINACSIIGPIYFCFPQNWLQQISWIGDKNRNQPKMFHFVVSTTTYRIRAFIFDKLSDWVVLLRNVVEQSPVLEKKWVTFGAFVLINKLELEETSNWELIKLLLRTHSEGIRPSNSWSTCPNFVLTEKNSSYLHRKTSTTATNTTDGRHDINSWCESKE